VLIVARPAEFGALKRQLFDAKVDTVAITATLRAAGGLVRARSATRLGFIHHYFPVEIQISPGTDQVDNKQACGAAGGGVSWSIRDFT
jgi:hypothetical protein